MTTSRRIFIAHAKEDKPAVQRLYRELKARGFEPWLDVEDLLPGQNWKVEIPKIIINAAAFLACLSSRSVAKVGYVQEEYRMALAACGQRPPSTIYVIPVRLDDCEVPDLQVPGLAARMRDYHWTDLFADNGFDRLVRSLTDGAGLVPAVCARPDETLPLEVCRDIEALWCPEMVAIPRGHFYMGSEPAEEGHSVDEGPLHFVQILAPFALGRYQVTFDEYGEFAATTGRELPSDEGWGRGRRPVINVSWHETQAYVAWLSERTGELYRLPSEAEWEYACRAGTITPFSFGLGIPADQANHFGDLMRYPGDTTFYREQTVPVESLAANAFGLHDMHGNVWEWCADVWHPSYNDAPRDGSAWIEGGEQDQRVLRGGSWNSGPRAVRSANRHRANSDVRSKEYGFRVARTLR